MRHLLAVAALVAAFVFLAPVASADGIPRGLGHDHEANGWYDSGCCSNEDCEPVEPGAVTRQPGGWKVYYMTSRGFIASGFLKDGDSGIRISKSPNDIREHACASPSRVICIYLPPGA
jgi:hypothetical protein